MEEVLGLYTIAVASSKVGEMDWYEVGVLTENYLSSSMGMPVPQATYIM